MKPNSLLNALVALSRRLDLNYPPTSVGGISEFSREQQENRKRHDH